MLLEYVYYGFISEVTKFEPDLTCLATVRGGESSMCKHAPYVNNFDFDLTYDVIGRLEVNEIRFRRKSWRGCQIPFEFLKSNQ